MRKIKIAIIDSGIDKKHIFYHGKLKGFYDLTEQYNIDLIEPYDHNGHGTACAYIIDQICKNYELYIIKIYNSKLKANSKLLIDALMLCEKLKIDIVNISLGMISKENIHRLKEICDRLYSKGTILVSSASESEGVLCWPADFDNVIKVSSSEEKGIIKKLSNNHYSLYDRNNRCAWVNGTYNIVYGNSFACARLTGIIADIITKKKLNDNRDIFTSLDEVAIFDSQDVVYTKKNILDIGIKNAAVFPFNKEIHSLLRFKDDLLFNILHVFDIPFLGRCGKDVGAYLNENALNISIKGNLVSGLNLDFDTMIFGDLSEISQLYKKDLLMHYSKLAFECGKNVISIEALPLEDYNALKEISKNFGVKFSALNDYVQPLRFIKNVPSIFFNTPILAIMGTGPQVGKFTFSHILKKALEQVGYHVSYLSTEPQGFLFGYDTIPLGNYNYLKLIPLEDQINYIKKMIIDSNQSENNLDLILVGGQSSVVPYSYNIATDYNSLSSIMVILASKPDGIILCINENDDIIYVKRTIAAIESFGYGKVFLGVMTSLSKKVLIQKGYRYIQNLHLSKNAIWEKCRFFESKLGIPIIHSLFPEDIKIGIKKIQEYLS